jgi:hypothetical protein
MHLIKPGTQLPPAAIALGANRFVSGLAPASAPRSTPPSDPLEQAFLGVTCSICGSSRVIRAGACGACLNCGNSTGC